MKQKTYWMRLLTISAVSAFGCVLSGCSGDSDIDLGDIDTTIGVGTNGLTIPASSTQDIKLKDVLNLKEDGVIKILENKDYQFQKSDVINPSNPRVKEVTVKKQSPITTPIPVTVPVGTSGDFNLPPSGNPEEIAQFNFNGTADKDIVSLSKVSIDGNIKLTITLPPSQNDNVTADLEIHLPSYIVFNNSEVTNHVIKKTGVALSKNSNTNINIDLSLKELTNIQTTIPLGAEDYVVLKAFNASNPSADRMQLQGKVKMKMTFHFPTATTTAISGNINTAVTLNDMTVTSATGKFDPIIDPQSSTIDISNDIPDFLDDPEVDIRLTNPQISLMIDNNINVEGIISGKLTAHYKDGSTKVLNLTKAKGASDIKMLAHSGPASTSTKTKIVVCRKDGTESGTQYVIKDGTDGDPDIQTILQTIPEKIDFAFNAKANTDKEGSIDLYKEGTEGNKSARGCGYEIKPSYDFVANLMMDAGSTIVYSDTIDGMNKDIRKNEISMTQGGSIIATAKVRNGTPMKLYLKPVAVGLPDGQGNLPELKDITVTVKTPHQDAKGYYVPSHLGTTDTSDLTVELKSSNPERYQDLEGLKVKVTAVTEKGGITLNSENQTIKVSEIRATLNGKVIINLDSK